ncbi:DUF11 domain-containing protein [Leifsonia poae]|uniref:DUF11 domain-containing protein n=1 Tax=Leifsonia poae TaxID=110933 RepID=UPI001CC0B52F|nr:DUF11 domain-containing protein [Leifsonia poae]
MKHIENADGTLIDSTPAGWAFTATSTGLSYSPQLLTTNGATGSVTYTLTVPAGATSVPVTVAETQKDNYQLVQQGGLNAVCTYADGTVVNVGTLGFKVNVPGNQNVRCVVVNREIPAAWSVSKTSDPASGTTVVPGQLITYTLNVQYTGGMLPNSLVITDDMSKVLDNATLVGDLEPTQGSAAIVGTNLVWTITGFDDSLSLSYTVRVNAGAYGVHIVNVLTVPPGGVCDESCTTDHPTPHWTLTKTADPASGSVVEPGQTITYTLTAKNDSDAEVTGATAVDSLGNVLDNAHLTGTLPAALSRSGNQLTWQVPTLEAGASETVSFSVIVNDDAAGVVIDNVVTPGQGGSCPPAPPYGPQPSDQPGCETTHRVPSVNLNIVKTHSTTDGGEGGVIDSGKNEVIDYQLAVGNTGTDAATGVTVTDALPAGLTFVAGSLVAPPGWSVTEAGSTLTFVYSGSLNPGATAVLTFRASVGDLSRSGIDVPYPNIDNRACVTSAQHDSDTSDNCSTDTTKVKSIAVSAQALCVNDAPVVSYSITPYNLTTAPKIALIWWTADAYAARNTSIPAGDEAALLANGASKVNYVTLPSGWVNGDTITGTQLWPGASVDASGHGNGWPGWRQLGDGTWVLDPAAPFYDLRTGAVVEVRINPTTASTVAYPPPSTHCDPAVTTTVAAGGSSTGLADTGSDTMGPLAGAAVLLGLGAGLVLWMRRRRGDVH